MKPNCRQLIVAAFDLQSNVFQQYLQRLREGVEDAFPGWNGMRVVDETEFKQEVLGQNNIGVCFAPIGMRESSRLNMIKGIRAAVVHNNYIAQMCRKHNDANVCVIGVESIGVGLSQQIVLSYITSAFDNEERNMLRLGKIREFEDKNVSL